MMLRTQLGDSFEALTGHRPFRWQQRLFWDWLSQGKLPVAVDVPTGLGKTAVMALWLLARAAGADLPRRLVYVVDRRAVVDQATRFAHQLRANMPDGLAARLGLSGGAGALPISTLRGGFADNRDWLEDPVKPSIVVGTIDMIGSRLLFEGYGISRRMRPYHAGFLGVDVLVLLDEAHLCPPFESLLRQLVDHRYGRFGPTTEDGPTAPPFRVVPLSATGRDMSRMPPESVFSLEDGDREEPVVCQRLMAHKRLGVIEVEDPRTLVNQMADRAVELGVDKSSRVVVYCDRRKHAVQVKTVIDKELKKLTKSGELTTAWESELLVGERRVYERVELEHWLERNAFLGDRKSPSQTPAFLVATSAGEVGVDLDADHMVCDLVAYERMVQRLGRVNRRGGENRSATVDVFAARPTQSASAGSGMAAEHERFKVRMNALLNLTLGLDGRRDASPSGTEVLKRNHPDIVAAATSSAPLHPELTRALVDAWSMTSLKQHEGRPEVGPWLRGWETDDDPQTEVVWRKYLPHQRRNGVSVSLPPMAARFFRSAPVHATEKLQALSSHVFDWLLKRARRIGRRHSDGRPEVLDEEIVAILVDLAGDYRTSARFGDLQRLAAPAKGMSKSERQNVAQAKRDWKEKFLPGALLFVDARMGGVRHGMLDDKSDSEVLAADFDDDWRAKKDDSSIDQPRPLIRFRVAEVASDKDGEGLNVATYLEDWRLVRTFETHFTAGGVAKRGLAVYKWKEDAADEDSRSVASKPQTLADHAERVAAHARDVATRLGLPDEEIEALSEAGRLHDDGKDSARWQDAMNAPEDGRPYAKTCGGGNWRLLGGYRHEFGSLLRAERASLRDQTRDLILHLVAAHHGNARPLISPEGCEDGPPSLMEAKAGEAALRFARLQKRYGPWGLAWREAILRAADQTVSRAQSTRDRRSENG